MNRTSPTQVALGRLPLAAVCAALTAGAASPPAPQAPRRDRGQPPTMQTRSAPATGERAQGGPPPVAGARFAAFTGGSYDAATREADVVLATGVRVRRSWYSEELDMSASAVDLSRALQNQVRLLFNHNSNDPIGVVFNVRLEGGVLLARVRFNDTDRGREFAGMVERGELTGISIGYDVRTWTLVETTEDHDVWRATAWSLLEGSLVSVPADPSAGVRSAALPPGDPATSQTATEDSDEMRNRSHLLATTAAIALAPETGSGSAPAAPAEIRAAPAPAPAPTAPVEANAVRFSLTDGLAFATQARALGATDDQVATWARDLTPDAARQALLAHAGEAQRTAAPTVPAGSSATIQVDERDTMRAGMVEALTHRVDPNAELTGNGRRFRGLSLLEMGRDNLRRNGDRDLEGLDRRQLAGRLMDRAVSTSDLPYVMGSVVNRSMRAGYEGAPRTFTAWARKATVADFRQVSRLQVGGVSKFVKVPEGGEFKRGSFGDSREVYALATFGRIIPITRQVIINDDLDFLGRMPRMLGQAAADFEGDTIYSILLDNPLMGDGVALFHATHGNLAAAGALADGTMEVAETLMAEQTMPAVGVDAGSPLNLAPSFLLVAPQDKNKGLRLLTAVAAGKTGDVNVYQNAMSLVVEARLKAVNSWFIAADPNRVDTVEYAYLEGDEGLYTEERQGFEVDGLEIKGRLDFAGKAIDHRGLVKTPRA